MGDTKMVLFFPNVSTINAFVSEIVFYGMGTVVTEVNYCSHSIKDYFTDEGVDRRNVWKE